MAFIRSSRSPLLSLFFAVLLTFFASGCSVFLAAKQPDYKNLAVLDVGSSRSNVVAELGAPVLSEQRDGQKVDIFAFRRGYSKGNKVGRALFHGTADVFTLGLWEVVGTPTEVIANGKDMKMEVFYDAQEKVRKVNYLTKKKEPSGETVKND